uniref:EF-hand domain family member B n=2 Tax=Latimeria chalumnae TaxID=7897 RepID=H2ZUK0_LATCH
RPIYEGKFTDRNPNIPSAGKLVPIGERAAGCLREDYPRPTTPPEVKKFLNSRRPGVAVAKVFYGKANDPDIASHMTHGITSQSSLDARTLVNPPPKTLVQQKLLDSQESLYLSHQNAPVGRSYDQSLHLPDGLDIYKTTFGQKSIKDLPVRLIVNPPKSHVQVEQESQEGHELYIQTHNDYNSGEQANRNYYCPSYNKDRRFGIETPHFDDGRNAAKSFRWLHDLQMERGTKIVSKRNDDFREKSQFQLGKTLDPIADSLKVPPNHTFGILYLPDEYGVAELLRHKNQNDSLRGKGMRRAVLSAAQQESKKNKYHNFDTVLDAFNQCDRKGDGKVDKEELQRIISQFNLYLNPQLLETLIDYCDMDKDGMIDYVEFINILNWKNKLTPEELEQSIIRKAKKLDTAGSPLPEAAPADSSGSGRVKPGACAPKGTRNSKKTPRALPKQAGQTWDHYHTTSSEINAVVGGISSANYPIFSVPSIRFDLRAPRIRRISDRINYGDESTIYGLLSPSIFSNKGVTEKEFFIPRSKEEIAQIFHSIGVELPKDTFEELWKLASKRHPRGEVCVETFRNILDEIK